MKRASSKPTMPASRLAPPKRSAPLHIASVNNDFTSLPSSTFAHGIPHCPVYYPTMQEFADPLAYIRKIKPEAEKTGICKIVPPREWNPDFALNSETFRFKTRKQEVNSMEGRTRVNINFLDTLQKFHALNGNPIAKMPSLNRKPLDMYRLRHEVKKRGGYLQVCEDRKWSEIGRSMGYGANHTSLASALKTCYTKYLIPFEEYLEKHGEAGSWENISLPSPPADSSNSAAQDTSTTAAALYATATSLSDKPVVSSPLKTEAPQAPLEPEQATDGAPLSTSDLDASNESPSTLSHSSPSSRGRGGGRRSRPGRTSLRDQPVATEEHADGVRVLKRKSNETDPARAPKYRIPPEADLPHVPLPANYQPTKGEELCEVCGHGHNRQLMVICEDCNRGYHAFCLDPVLVNHPRTLPEWYCSKCVVETGNDYGFEDGQEYSLTEFQAVANKFKEEWFRERVKGGAEHYGLTPGSKWLYVTEEEVEREFWRITECPFETVEVEYGADLHSSVHGSGFPTTERDPSNPYATDPANLNCLPLLPGSLFSNIKADISGMMIPWLYIGMCFSTFCWHAEDHWLYSANYQHWGDTKTWYGIPESDIDKFEQAMRAAVPKLFEKNPDLLFHITTTLSPSKLAEAGVKVYGCHQRAGEFVISFPAAYHAGFNHGFNCNEAVNFAPPDWLDSGLACVKKYKQFSKAPVFSHDELLIETAARDGTSLNTATWLAPHLKDMLQRDRQMHKVISERLPDGFRQVVDDAAETEEQYHCHQCNTYCYLTSVRCSCGTTSKSACEDHIQEAIVQQVVDVAEVPEKWVTNFRSLMAQHSLNHTRPHLQELQDFLRQSHNIQCVIDEAVNLKRFLEGAAEWIDRSLRLLKKIPARKRDRDKPTKRSVDDYEVLLSEGEALYFDCGELEQLRQAVADINRLRDRARQLQESNVHASLDEYHELLGECARADVDVPEAGPLRAIIKELEWRSRAQSPENADFDRITALLEEAKALGLANSADLIQELHARRSQGEAWNMRAQGLLIMDKIDLLELEEVARSAVDSHGQKALQMRISDLFTRVQDWRTSAEALVERVRACQRKDIPPDSKLRPSADDLRQVLARVQILPIQPPEPYSLINLELRKIESWSIKAKRLFAKPSIPRDLTHILADFLNALEPVADIQYDTSLSQEVHKRRRISCFCRQVESGFMLACEVCHESYHSNCVKISRKEARKTAYVCPVCDLTTPVPRRGNNTPIEQIRGIYEDGSALAFMPSELHILHAILTKAERFQQRVQEYLASKSSLEWSKSDVAQIKFYLRKAEGLDLALPEVSQLRDLVAELAAYIPKLQNEDELLCFCQQQYSTLISMVCCDVCDDWFHFGCVNLVADTIKDEEHYVCPMCCYKRNVDYKFGDVTIPPSYPPFLAYLTTKSNADEKLLEEARAAHQAKEEQRRMLEEQEKRAKSEEAKKRRQQMAAENDARKRKKKAEAKELKPPKPMRVKKGTRLPPVGSIHGVGGASAPFVVPPPARPVPHKQHGMPRTQPGRVPPPLRPITPPSANSVPPPFGAANAFYPQPAGAFALNPFNGGAPIGGMLGTYIQATSVIPPPHALYPSMMPPFLTPQLAGQPMAGSSDDHTLSPNAVFGVAPFGGASEVSSQLGAGVSLQQQQQQSTEYSSS
ncbi:hypothetical protein RI367_004870 [Sorochytrium milnesiophthora]